VHVACKVRWLVATPPGANLVSDSSSSTIPSTEEAQSPISHNKFDIIIYSNIDWRTNMYRTIPQTNYKISKTGIIRLIRKSQQHPAGYKLKPYKTRGYERIKIRQYGVRKAYMVHHLVERTWGGWHVNHKNKNKADNDLTNLSRS